MKPLRVILLEAVSTGEQAEADEESLPDQDTRLRALAQKHNWRIVDVILIPGHSRVYYNYREFSEAALEEGIPGPMRMFEHWAQKDFDVFACTSGDRFGREQSIFAEVVGRTIDAGAVVYTLRDGEINAGNKRMFISMGGYAAASEIDELKRRRKSGMLKRVKKGLPTGSGGLIVSHTVIQVGKDEYKTIVNEKARRLFADLAELILAGVSWRQISVTLAARGHCRPDGRPWSPGTLAKWLMHPTLWGNGAQYFSDIDHHTTARGFWVFDETEAAPEHVIIYYHTHEPMYSGELAERIQAELRRRYGLNGKAHPAYRGKFAGLVLCDSCHYAAAYKRAPYYTFVYCISNVNPDIQSGCTDRKRVNEKKLVRFADAMLRELLETTDWTSLYATPASDDTADRLAALEAEIADTRARVTQLIVKQSTMPAVLADSYDTQIRALGETLEALQHESVRLRKALLEAAPRPAQTRTLGDIKALGMEAFWGQDDREINQWLSRLMGNLRFVIRGGEVIGVTSASRKHQQRRYTYKTRGKATLG